MKIPSILLSLLSGLLFVFAWPVSDFTPLIFIGWIPVFYLCEQENKGIRFFWFTYVALLIWNAGTTWWIWNSTQPGAVAAIVVNSLFMSLPLVGFNIFRTKYGQRAGWLAFVIFWLSFEYIHLNWQLSWPWLTLGNVFATHTNWIQWYEFTGVSGGSLWVLLVNIFVYKFLRSKEKTIKYKWASVAFLVIIIPFGISVLLKPKPSAQAALSNVIVVQPNIDPYTVKFDITSTNGQVQKLISLSEKELDSNTTLIVWPETALPIGVWQDQVMQSQYYKPVFDFVNRHPNVTIETGIETLKNYGKERATKTARKEEASGTYYDVFNAAISIKANQPIQFYNKSKLVPGVETLPDFLLWTGSIFEKFGGTAGGYGHDKESAVFKEPGNPYVTAPIICYESIYGEYVSSYVKKGANLLTIITNDGWWGNTAGHKQHLQYARLRALENRKWVARSANTGISAVIDNTGEIRESRKWDEAAFIKFPIPVDKGLTFYVINGPLIFRLAIFLMVVLLGYHFIMILKKRFISKNK